MKIFFKLSRSAPMVVRISIFLISVLLVARIHRCGSVRSFTRYGIYYLSS
ncbi:hypothetical protein LINGRAHAP2_LOCUS30092 [Linum grandiflorum]